MRTVDWPTLDDTHASLSCLACSGVSIPSVVHTSMSMARTSRTICRMRWKPRLRPARSRHAAPMQKRVLPLALALRAASRTGSTSRSGDALVVVEYRDDCEQYEPAKTMVLVRAFFGHDAVPYSSRNTLQLQDKIRDQRSSHGSRPIFGDRKPGHILLMFISVHSWTLKGSWCWRCTLLARWTRSSRGPSYTFWISSRVHSRRAGGTFDLFAVVATVASNRRPWCKASECWATARKKISRDMNKGEMASPSRAEKRRSSLG